MDLLDIYTFSNIIEYCDIDTLLILMRITRYLHKYTNLIPFECFLKMTRMKELLKTDPKNLLQYGIQFSSLRFVRHAIKCGLTISCEQMQDACYIGNADIVKHCICYGSAVPSHGMFYACFQGHLHIVKILCAKGISDEILKRGLVYACASNHRNIVKYLIKYYNVTDIDTLQEGFDIAYQVKHIEILELLVKELFMNNRKNHGKIKHLKRKMRKQRLCVFS